MKNHRYSEKPFPGSFPRHILFHGLVAVIITMLAGCRGDDRSNSEANRVAKLFPPYYDLTIPPNIAPLNFIIQEPGSGFRVEISAGNSKTIKIRQCSPEITIPLQKWHNILSGNSGKTVQVNISVLDHNRWTRYEPITHHIASDPIDPVLAYRKVHAVYLIWREMGIYTRNLTNFDERPLIENYSTGYGCMNCHSFSNNDPSKMLIHFRIVHPGTLILNEGMLLKVNTRTPDAMSAGIYPSWHPDGNHIAFSTGKISPHLTTRLNKVVDVADRSSDLVVYDVKNNTVTTSPGISTGMRENMPAWSADGRYLYFICAPEAVKGDDESLLHSRYSLMRIAYSTKLNSWGEPEMVLSADSTGMSISMPSVSPGGKYLVCSMTDYGYFTIFHKGSDLYVVDLETNNYRKLELNSGSAESHPSWSSNGRWLVFSSKRMDDVLSRTYIAYFDRNGVAHTPFVLPIKNPGSYHTSVFNYNLPRLVTGRIETGPVDIRDALQKGSLEVDFE
ncbi:MAG: PD40 domain-containing protein [Bacteroidales bacterium]|nr:PD40 domain-containing protein [Bacteroidales bacterium]